MYYYDLLINSGNKRKELGLNMEACSMASVSAVTVVSQCLVAVLKLG